MTENIQEIWQDYHLKLHRFIDSRISDPSMADDILQDVFTRIQTRIGTLKDTSKIKSWIYQITRNAIIDYYRSQKQLVELPESLAAPEEDESEKTREEIAGWLLPMIRSLPEPYREALILAEIEGLTQREVAKMQGLSLSGAKSRVQRGRSMLKDTLVECCRFEFDHQGKVVDYERKGHGCDNC
ncbi:MAG: RNA polymerase sigma factor SigZ [Candidatus Adiutricales bacterium]